MTVGHDEHAQTMSTWNLISVNAVQTPWGIDEPHVVQTCSNIQVLDFNTQNDYISGHPPIIFSIWKVNLREGFVLIPKYNFTLHLF